MNSWRVLELNQGTKSSAEQLKIKEDYENNSIQGLTIKNRVSLLNCSFNRCPKSSFRDAFLLTNIPFGLDGTLKASEIENVYSKFEGFLKENFEEFREVHIINVINEKPKNFVKRHGNGLKWELKFRFYSGGLELGVFQLVSADWRPETKHIDNPFKIIKKDDSSQIPTKGEIKRKLNYAQQTGTAPNLTKKEWFYKKKYQIHTKYDLERIDSMDTSTKAKKQLYEKLKARKRNEHLTSKKSYEQVKSERIFKKIFKQDEQKVKMLEENIQGLLEEARDPQIGELWERMSRPVLGTRGAGQIESHKHASQAKLNKTDGPKKLGQ